MTPDTARAAPSPPRPLVKVAVVGDSPDLIDWLCVSLDPGHYDVVFLDATGDAYSCVRDLLPDLVVLCAHVENAAAFQFLTVMALDPDTQAIPVKILATGLETPPDGSGPSGTWEDYAALRSRPRSLPLN